MSVLFLAALTAAAQASDPAPVTISLQDALARARQYAGQIQSAELAAALAREDRKQARAALLPTLSALNQFIYTEGNGTPSGVFVANDGVHVYNEQAVVREDLFSVVRRADLRRAKAAEAVAGAKRDVAARGLQLTVIQNYYAIVSAQRRAENARVSLTDAADFLRITKDQEAKGEAARADTVKAQIQQQGRERDLLDARIAVEKAKIALGVLIFPDVTRDFSVEDDLDKALPLEEMHAVETQAVASSPDLRAAQNSVTQAHNETSVAKYAYLPSLGLEFYYGIDANQFTDVSAVAQATGRSTLPDYLVHGRQNLGYSGAVTLNIPVWDWGAIRSKVRQARYRENQAQFDLTVTQKQVRADVSSAYLEASAAGQQIASLRDSLDLSQESLRLTRLRYQAGEATVLEVVDAQTTLAAARNAYTDGLERYRIAVAALNTLTGHI